jgi:hypothetical protein
MSPDKFAEDVQVILDSQRQVMERTQLSLSRLLERVAFSDASYDRAVEHLKQAVAHMEAAIEQLAAKHVQNALSPEQLALQAMLKAESESRQTMIQMARNGGGADNGMHGEREDLQELFAMEMGRLENRYELPQRGGGHEQGTEQEDILEQLRHLARRQEHLNRRQRELDRRQEHMTEAQQKRRLEELRRQQEELRREAQNLSRRMSQLARHEGFRQWSDRQQQVQQAARQMQEASRSLQQQEPQSAAAKGQQAFEHLRQQEREMSLQRQTTVTDLRRDLKTKARDLQTMEKQVLNHIEELTRPKDHTAVTAETDPATGINEVIERKDSMVRQLADAKTLLQKLDKTTKQDHPDIAARASDTLGSLQAEGLETRIKESRQLLQEGWLSRSMAVEKRIDQSIDRVGTRLQELDHTTPESRYEGIIWGDLPKTLFTAEQLAMTRDFVSERGGGFLMLGGSTAFDEGFNG